MLLQVLGITLIVTALTEIIHVSAAVGAFLIGLARTGTAADRARTVLSPPRDFSPPCSLLLMLHAAVALAMVTAAIKPATGRPAVLALGEPSVVIISLAAPAQGRLAALVTTYVVLIAVCGAICTRFAPTRSAAPSPAASRKRAASLAPYEVGAARP